MAHGLKAHFSVELQLLAGSWLHSDQMDLEVELRQSRPLLTHEARYLMYIHQPSMLMLKQDLAENIQPSWRF